MKVKTTIGDLISVETKAAIIDSAADYSKALAKCKREIKEYEEYFREVYSIDYID